MMSAAVARLGDLCSGHEAFPSRPSIGASPNVYVNGRALLRQDDAFAVHTDGRTVHGGVVSGGSATVFCNGRAVARVGDAVSCGSSIAQGSPNVRCG